METKVPFLSSVPADTLAARSSVPTAQQAMQQRNAARTGRSKEAPTPVPGSMHAADSLLTDNLSARAADFARNAADSAGILRDSGFAAANTLLPATANPYREVTPQAFFGEASTLAQPPKLLRHETQPLTGDPFFQVFLLLLAALYARFVYHNLGDVCQLFARTTKNSMSGKQRAFDEQSNAGYSRFLNAVWAVGLLFAGAAALKFGAAWPSDTLPRGGALVLCLGITAGCLLLALVQFGALSLAGAVTRTQVFTGQLIHLRRTYFAVAFLALAPVCLLYILCGEGQGEGCLYLLIAEAVIIGFLFLKESLTLFISKKIPILHWFLYLCTVECLPVSFIVLTAVRQ